MIDFAKMSVSEILEMAKKLADGSKHKLLFGEYIQTLSSEEARSWAGILAVSQGGVSHFLSWLDKQETKE